MCRDKCRECKFKLLCIDGSSAVNSIVAHAICERCHRRGLYSNVGQKAVIHNVFYVIGEFLQSDISDCGCVNADDYGRTVCRECAENMVTKSMSA